MKTELKRLFSEFCKSNNLSLHLSFCMPSGYETAYGTFDVCKSTLFFNFEILKKEPVFKILFHFYHELRHAEQYLLTDKFNRRIKESINYVIMFDGTCYKLANNNWKCCKIEDENVDFMQAYLSLPYEMDANKFAYTQLKKQFKDEKELKHLFKLTQPTTKLHFSDLKRIFKKIDELTKNFD